MALQFLKFMAYMFLVFFLFMLDTTQRSLLFCIVLSVFFFGFRMLLKPFSLEAHSRMLFSMLQKVLKRNPSRRPSIKVWILKVSSLSSFILKAVERAGVFDLQISDIS